MSAVAMTLSSLDATPEPSYEEIARLAYQLWEERGRESGNPEDDWFRAEAVLRQEA
jgi:hypothetical protein